jgi:hypothetical protein
MRRALAIGTGGLGALLLGALVCTAVVRSTPGTLSEREAMAVQRAAVLTLFVEREHARILVFWNDGAHPSPTLRLLQTAGVAVDAQQPDTAALDLPLPVHVGSTPLVEPDRYCMDPEVSMRSITAGRMLRMSGACERARLGMKIAETSVR